MHQLSLNNLNISLEATIFSYKQGRYLRASMPKRLQVIIKNAGVSQPESYLDNHPELEFRKLKALSEIFAISLV